jgi:hypothetical protein
MPKRVVHVYEPVLSSSAAAFLVEQSKRVQRSLIGLIERMAEHPAQLGEYSTKDSSGRTLQVLRAGKFTLTYWADDPVKELRIMEISVL